MRSTTGAGDGVAVAFRHRKPGVSKITVDLLRNNGPAGVVAASSEIGK